MGLADMLFNCVLAALALVLIVAAASGWRRTKRSRYLVVGGVSLVIGLGWVLRVLSGTVSSTDWLYTLAGLIICTVIVSFFRRSDRSSEPTDSVDAQVENPEERMESGE